MIRKNRIFFPTESDEKPLYAKLATKPASNIAPNLLSIGKINFEMKQRGSLVLSKEDHLDDDNNEGLSTPEHYATSTQPSFIDASSIVNNGVGNGLFGCSFNTVDRLRSSQAKSKQLFDCGSTLENIPKFIKNPQIKKFEVLNELNWQGAEGISYREMIIGSGEEIFNPSSDSDTMTQENLSLYDSSDEGMK